MSLKALTDVLFLDLGAFDLAHDFAAFQYLGFNPEKVAELVKAAEPNEKALTKDLIQLILFATIRGTNFTKAVVRMDPEGARIIQSLIIKYKIKRNASEANFNEITLTRLTAAFPGVTLKVREKLGDHCPVVGTLPDKMPAAFAFPSAPACIPQNDTSRYNVWLQWARSFGEVIKSPTDPDQYGKIALGSTVTNAAQRAGLVKSWTG